MAPFLANLSGTNLFLYINLGSKDLVFGALEGVSHNAFTDTFDLDLAADYPAIADFEEYLEDAGFESHSYTIGPVTLYTETGGGFRPYRFSITPDADYFAVEFPWLLMPLATGAYGIWRLGRASKRRDE